MYFPNRLELSLRFVFAFPKAVSTNINQVVVLKLLMKGLQYSYKLCAPSRMGLASRICCSIHECCPLTTARNCRINLVDSVFPAPLSPLWKSHDSHLIDRAPVRLPDDDALVPLPSLHEVVGIVSDGKNVGRFLSNLLVPVLAYVLLVIDWQ